MTPVSMNLPHRHNIPVQVLRRIYHVRHYGAGRRQFPCAASVEHGVSKHVSVNKNRVKHSIYIIKRMIREDYARRHNRMQPVSRIALAGRQQKLNRHLHDLFKLVDELNAVAIVTNQVMSNPGVFFGDPTKPIGGNIVGHSATFRLYLRKSKAGKRIARLVDSPNLPEGEATFMVETAGIKPC